MSASRSANHECGKVGPEGMSLVRVEIVEIEYAPTFHIHILYI